MLSIILSNLMGVNGLALSTAITTTINAVILLCVANRKEKEIISKELMAGILKMLLSALVMGVIVYVANSYLTLIIANTWIGNVVRMIIGATIGVVVYYILTLIFNVNELNLFKLGGKN